MLKRTCTKRIRKEAKSCKPSSIRCSMNEERVDLVDEELEAVVRVIKPSRASRMYERME